MEKGIRNLPTYGEVLVREARRDIGNGKLVEAQEILSVARRLAPETLPVYFAAASLTLKREFWNLLEGGREIAKGAKAAGRSFRLQSWVAANLFFTASLGLLIYFAVVIGIMLLRNAGRIAHDIAEGFPRALSTGVRRVLGWLVFFLPLLVALPAWWWFILAGVALWPYLERLPRLQDGARLLRDLAQGVVALEDRMLMDLYHPETSEQHVTGKELTQAERRYDELLLALYALQFKRPDYVTLALFGEDTSSVIALASAYYYIALQLGLEVQVGRFHQPIKIRRMSPIRSNSWQSPLTKYSA